MTISILVSTFNRATLLRETLDRLRKQRFEHGDELIVVNNASTDDTANVIEAASAAFPVPLRHLHEPVAGKSWALNRAIATANGDVLALTDDDVLVADDWLETLRQIFEDPAIGLVGGRVDPRWEKPAPVWLRVDDGEYYNGMSAPLALLHYGQAQDLGDRSAVGANMGVRRAIAQQVGGFATHLGRKAGTLLCGEDHDLCARVSAAGFRCEYRPELRVLHWVPADRLTLRYFIRWFFWSGITEVVLERTVPSFYAVSPARRNLPREFVSGIVRGVADLLRRRQADAALHVMDASCALGRMLQHWRDWWNGEARGHHAQAGPAEYLASETGRQ
jgi:glycosyltransferase involved in cell wall biosynthesis